MFDHLNQQIVPTWFIDIVFELSSFWKKITLHQFIEWHSAGTNQTTILGYVSRTNLITTLKYVSDIVYQSDLSIGVCLH